MMLFQSLPGNLRFCGREGDTPSGRRDRFQFLPGNLRFCGVSPQRRSPASMRFQSLPGNLRFCGDCTPPSTPPAPTLFQSLPGNLRFCGGGDGDEASAAVWFQSLPGNLRFCGWLPILSRIFRVIALNARVSLPDTSKRPPDTGGLGASYPSKLWYVNCFFISERLHGIS
jgi:hypothetical protein